MLSHMQSVLKNALKVSRIVAVLVYDCPLLAGMTHAFFVTLGALAGVMASLAVFVAAAQIILKLFISPTCWGIAASVVAICTVWTIWNGHQRVVHVHSLNHKHEMAKEAEAWRQLQPQRVSGFRKSPAET